jgi:hypothetical protein
MKSRWYCIVIGGVAFWLPAIVLSAIFHEDTSVLWLNLIPCAYRLDKPKAGLQMELGVGWRVHPRTDLHLDRIGFFRWSATLLEQARRFAHRDSLLPIPAIHYLVFTPQWDDLLGTRGVHYSAHLRDIRARARDTFLALADSSSA